MLYALLYPLRDNYFLFNVLKYITFRSAMASVTAFLLTVWLGPILIKRLKADKCHHSNERAGFSQIADQSKIKSSVPTMGGLLIIAGVTSAVILWGELGNRLIWIALGAMIWLGGLGFVDDLLKLQSGNSKGLNSKAKLSAQLALAMALGCYLYLDNPAWANIQIPFLKESHLHLGWWYLPFVALVITGTSNAVNLTDGLDGLAAGCTVMVALSYTVLSYITGHILFAEYLLVPYIPGAGELTVVCAALAGATLGFLWFNSHPAEIFMGDTGSLSLGGVIGTVAVLTKKELLLLLIGGVFVVEALSVILQVASFKLTGKRIFLMAPFHHHFQMQNRAESKIVIRFWIIASILSLAGIASLKLR